jgi:predicted nucleic acid-binding protein
MRDLFLQLAVTDLFHAKWSADIHREWINALLAREPHRDLHALERTRDKMDTAIRDCLVTGYEPLVSSLSLPDPDDRHVLAAAIVGRCDVIVTQNLKDFPEVVLSEYGIEALHPDDFLRNHLHLAPGIFLAAVQKVRARLQNPPFSAQEYLDNLAMVGLRATALELRQYITLI